MAWMDWLVASAIFLPLLAYSIFAANQQLSAKVGMQTYEVKLKVVEYWRQFFETFGSPSDWSANYWESIGLAMPLYKLTLVVKEQAGIARSLEPVDIHVVFDPSCEQRALNSTVRLFSKGVETPFSLYNISYCSPSYLKEANIVFLANVSANETAVYYLYFSNDSAILPPSYTSDLSYSSYLQNSKVKLNLTGEVSDVYSDSTDLLSGRRLGIVQYNASTGTVVETNATTGSPTLVVDTALKKVVVISGTTDWYDYRLNITLYAYQPWFKVDAWVKENTSVHLDDFRMPEAELYSAFSAVYWRNASGEYSSTDASGLVNASWIAPYNASVYSLSLLRTNDTKAEWEGYGERIAFTKGSLDATAGSEWSDTAYALPFTALDDVRAIWSKLSNPLKVDVLPVEQLKAVSVSKLKELKKVNYSEAREALGGYDFEVLLS